jgi:RING-variant domain
MPPQVCRFCLETDEPSALVSPCLCTGSIGYIHSNCLLKWYTTNPERGLHCSICKEPLAKRLQLPLEDGFPQERMNQLGLFNPFLTVFSWHWGTLCICSLFFKSLDMFQLYVAMQVAFHIRYGLAILSAIQSVRTKKLYWKRWLLQYRVFFLVLHCMFGACFQTTVWISGIAMDLCCIQWCQLHAQILAEINAQNSIEFTNHPRLLLSSSEPAS